jgi:hypothetical protein
MRVGTKPNRRFSGKSCRLQKRGRETFILKGRLLSNPAWTYPISPGSLFPKQKQHYSNGIYIEDSKKLREFAEKLNKLCPGTKEGQAGA